jgi:hypothetical protein
MCTSRTMPRPTMFQRRTAIPSTTNTNTTNIPAQHRMPCLEPTWCLTCHPHSALLPGSWYSTEGMKTDQLSNNKWFQQSKAAAGDSKLIASTGAFFNPPPPPPNLDDDSLQKHDADLISSVRPLPCVGSRKADLANSSPVPLLCCALQASGPTTTM